MCFWWANLLRPLLLMAGVHQQSFHQLIFLPLLRTELPNHKFLLVFSMMSDALDLISIMMVCLTVWPLTSWQLEWLSLLELLKVFQCQFLPKRLKFSGPYHHKSLSAKSSTDIPRDSTSAGFSFAFTWFYFPGADNLWISLILFATCGLNFLLWFLTHHKTFILSVQ